MGCILLMAALLGIGSGCGAALAPAGTPSPTATASPSPRVSIPAGAEQAIAQARADAASRTGIEAARWQTLEVTARDWPDAGLGCPEQGKMYAQVLTPGHVIRLQAAGRTLEYHSGGGRVAYCGG